VLRYLHKKNIIVRNLNMTSFRLYEPGSIADVRLMDMLLAVKTSKTKAEAGNLLEEQIFV